MSDCECCKERWGQCCCNCKWQYIDRSHPGTDGKRSWQTRGYICAEPRLGYHSGWSEHGVCECWIERPSRPIEVVGNDSSHYEVEAWDARYEKREARHMWNKLK